MLAKKYNGEMCNKRTNRIISVVIFHLQFSYTSILFFCYNIAPVIL